MSSERDTYSYYLKQKNNRQNYDNLLSIIRGGGGGGSMGGVPGPAGVMAASANSTPVKLMQNFLNSRGWGDAAVGNTPAQPMQQQQAAEADRWAALAQILQGGGGYNPNVRY